MLGAEGTQKGVGESGQFFAGRTGAKSREALIE